MLVALPQKEKQNSPPFLRHPHLSGTFLGMCQLSGGGERNKYQELRRRPWTSGIGSASGAEMASREALIVQTLHSDSDYRSLISPAGTCPGGVSLRGRKGASPSGTVLSPGPSSRPTPGCCPGRGAGPAVLGFRGFWVPGPEDLRWSHCQPQRAALRSRPRLKPAPCRPSTAAPSPRGAVC